MKKVFLDVECYIDYFLICFKSDNKVRSYELHNDSTLNIPEIKLIMSSYLTIGFNSFNYDLPMVSYALQGASNLCLNKLSHDLVSSGKKSWEVCNEYNIKVQKTWNHIDLIEPAPAVMVSLKMYGARMHTKKLQDLPFEPQASIKKHERNILKQYCINDIDITIELYNKIKNIIDLRENMNQTQVNNISNPIDFRSKSDAQIAEAIFRKSLNITSKVQNKIDTSYNYSYRAPSYINFINNDLVQLKNRLENATFNVDSRGALIPSNEVLKKITIGSSTYTIGIGGLHSNEKNRATIKKDNEFLIDIDVVSYYPSIIINNGYYPSQIGKKFLNYYSHFYKERLKAKEENDKTKSDVYKIILNGSFGKFGSIYSCLYSPSLLLHTTITGQLTLLMLIEIIESCNCSVISANTDGLTIKGDISCRDQLNIELNKWQHITNLKLEKVEYKAIYHEGVNTYIAIKDDGSLKTKGYYANNGIAKHPIIEVCVKAVISYLKYNKPIEDSIYDKSNTITDFICMRKVTGGGIFKNEYLGKTVRWYYSTNGDAIRYKKNNNLVANSEGCRPIMDIPDIIMDDIDYNKYTQISKAMLLKLGVPYVN